MNVIPQNFDWREWTEEDEHAKIIRPSSLTDSVVESFFLQDELQGEHLPWDKADEYGLRMRSHEVTLYSGINGHYKSIITSQIALHLMRQGVPTLIASFEMRPTKTMHRMTRQAAGSADPSSHFIRKFHEWTDGKLWLYDHLGTCLPRQVEAVCRYAAVELGIKHIFIDSLMKCTTKTDDYTEQKMFVAQLNALALRYGVHIHLVSHARKSGAETDRIDKFSIRGGGEMADQADNIVLIQRNKGGAVKKDADFEDNTPVDVFIEWAKQRDGEFEGTLGLWFNPASLCAVERPKGNWPRINLEAA